MQSATAEKTEVIDQAPVAQRSPAPSNEPKSLDQLLGIARDLAAKHRVRKGRWRRPSLRAQIRKCQSFLEQVHQTLSRDAQKDVALPSSAEWILDNFFVIEDQLREVVDDLPPQYERLLPAIGNRMLRVQQIGRELVAHTDNALDEDTISQFINEFQSVDPLTIGELWAVPIMLRIALIENLCALGERVLRDRLSKWDAAQVCEQWIEQRSLNLGHLPAAHVREITPDLVELLHTSVATHGEAISELAQRLAKSGESIADVIHAVHQRRATDQVSIANVVTSMRLLSALDWVVFFERHSLVEQRLRNDPSGIYPRLDFPSRDRYRHVVERLAKGSHKSDVDVAIAALKLAHDANSRPEADRRQTQVGYWLQDQGEWQLARHLGYRARWNERVRRWMLRRPSLAYFGMIAALLTFGVAAFCRLSVWMGAPGAIVALLAVVSLIPISEFVILLVNLIITTRIAPRLLPQLDYSKGIPHSLKTVVAIPCLLSSRREVAALLANLEVHYHSNVDPALRFVLLSDFTDHADRERIEDGPLLALAVEGIRRLNAKYGTKGLHPFYLLHRPRSWNAGERIWMGWERKRGKILDFIRFLHDGNTSRFEVVEGDENWLLAGLELPAVSYVIALDADTQLMAGAAAKLVGIASHPLNQPRHDPETHRVVEGYGLLQPRVNTRFTDAARTYFARTFANSPGLDPYSTSASDVYQDLFGEGSFIGKGILDVRAFHQALRDTFPDNQILSHDLIESCHVRAALVSDVELADGFPTRYDAEVRRQHRWCRGDWQLLPWLGGTVPLRQGSRPNPLSTLSRWKVFDNLRRSLIAPCLFLALLLNWFLMPAAAWLVTLIGIGTLAFPLFAQMVQLLRSFHRTSSWPIRLQAIRSELIRELVQFGVLAAMLPHRAFFYTDAIARTLWRQFVSKTKKLEWETSAAAERRLAKVSQTTMWALIAFALIAIGLSMVVPSAALPWATPWLVAWIAAPVVRVAINRPIPRNRYEFNESDRRNLREIARETWAFFETYVTAEDNWLPPDNVQEIPSQKIAHRVSPTNQGLFLVSSMVARDLGYIGLHDLTTLWERNLSAWERLDRFQQHFFNWYETTTLRPLIPRYVSTVDSGNLDACFIAMKYGIDDLRAKDILAPELQDGIIDGIAMIRAEMARLQIAVADANSPKANDLSSLCAQIETLVQGESLQPVRWLRVVDQALALLTDALAREANRPAQRPFETNSLRQKLQLVERQLRGQREDLTTFFAPILFASSAGGLEPLEQPPAVEWMAQAPEAQAIWATIWRDLIPSKSLPSLTDLDVELNPLLGQLERIIETLPESSQQSAKAWIGEFAAATELVSSAAQRLLDRLHSIAAKLSQLSSETDYRFLYDPQRKLFAIGFNLEGNQLDRAHYDMLCSEARLASLLAIAKGQVEPRHWFRLGRQLSAQRGNLLLLSWGGSMFEYMMPALFTWLFHGSLLDIGCRAAIGQHRRHGQRLEVPWGISESAYAAMALNGDYHYKSFGAPGVGLKRGLGKDLVVSPYSTFLALEIEGQGALANLRALSSEGARGTFGFYEALDYTPGRTTTGQRRSVVRCHMAHHQSMSILAIFNALSGGKLRSRFHRDPAIRAVELLLQERMPSDAIPVRPNQDEVETPHTVHQDEEYLSRRIVGVPEGSPRTHLLSNGHWTSMLTSSGGGYCRWEETAVTRWRADATRDHWGQFIYFRDKQTGALWSATYQPTTTRPDQYEVRFSIDKAEFLRQDDIWESKLDIAVSPENNAELRLLRITNHSAEAREIEITSYVEISLTTAAADLAHPAFEKLFLQTERLPSGKGWLAWRRPKENRQPALWVAQVATLGDSGGPTEFESSRPEFVGRGKTLAEPAALCSHKALSGKAGPVLDPIFAMRSKIRIRGNESATIGFALAAGSSRAEVEALAFQYQDLRNIQRGFELAWAYTQMQLRHLRLSPTQAHVFQRLASPLLYSDVEYRGDHERIAANEQSQSGLWRFGISGDRPLVLLHMESNDDLPVARELVEAQQYWWQHGLAADIVFLNDQPGSYIDQLHEQLIELVHQFPRLADQKQAGVFLLRTSHMSPSDANLLEAVASIVMRADQGPLAQQLAAATRGERSRTLAASRKRQSATVYRGIPQSPKQRDQRPANQLASAWSQRIGQGEHQQNGTAQFSGVDDEIDESFGDSNRQAKIQALKFWNGHGGFRADGREYQILVHGRAQTPLPWSNVIASPNFGCLVTESGGGFTWSANCRENKLTAWANDPVIDTPSEGLYLRDDDRWEAWSPLPALLDRSGDYWIHHGQGYSSFYNNQAGFDHQVDVFVSPDDPIKFVRIRLSNQTPLKRRLSLFYFADWVLGDFRERTAAHIVTFRDELGHALMARNRYHPDFPDQIAFLSASRPMASISGDRTEFLGRCGNPFRPHGLAAMDLSGNVGVRLDPCGAVHVLLEVEPRTTEEVTFCLGAGKDLDDARRLVAQYATANEIDRAWSETHRKWDEILGAVQIETPDESLNLLFNRWLLYQVISCRLWGRTAYYQCGGAFGFRDQLQDVMAAMYSRPDLARQHLLLAASRQFEEGDAQHWWHPPLGRGPRTRSSDDFLWLPFTVTKYVEVTGDKSILDEIVPFVHSAPLADNELERYETPQVSAQTATLFEHCVRAVRNGLKFGEHDLPLIGTGDWNDGFSRVGEAGRGESVWLGWMLMTVLARVAEIAEQQGELDVAHEFVAARLKLAEAIEVSGWDGSWYRRAYNDAGVAIGSQQNSECQIDSIAQSWSVFAGAPHERAEEAVAQAFRQLVLPQERITLLLTPPFDRSDVDPGYIQGYLPGIRENGGQYSHAAIWLMQALCHLHKPEKAWTVLTTLNPVTRSSKPAEVQKYQVEPYVLAADIYGMEPHVGRGGWTWYTGSAAWLYRAILESLLGFRFRGERLTIAPCVPAEWSEFRVTLSKGSTCWRITVRRDSPTEEMRGAKLDYPIFLSDDGSTHDLNASF